MRSFPSWLLVALALASCGRQELPESEVSIEKRVVVSNYPLAWMTGQIDSDGIEVYFPEIVGDPAFWQPSRGQIAVMQAADLILLNGAGYEGWRLTTSLPESRVVESLAGLEERFLESPGKVEHRHGPEGVHSHGGLATTTWLDFSLAGEQAVRLRDALVERGLVEATSAAENLAALRAQLDGLDARMKAVGKALAGAPLVASHPVYPFLAERYELNMDAVHWEPGGFPDATQWAELEALLEWHPAEVMLWEGPPSEEVRRELEERGIESLVFDPCGNRPAAGDFLSVMTENVERLEGFLAGRYTKLQN
ncbi:MAG: metal ABC transporter substrate-binding protein [Verrucomicrobiota bacterium]